MADQSTQSIRIAAEPPAIMAVISDFDAYPTWTGSVKQAEVLESGPDGRAKRVAFTLDAGILKDAYELEYVWTGDQRVDWTLVKGQMQKAQQGSYVLSTSDGGAGTEVTYSLTVDLAIPMLGMLKRKAEKVILDTALKELKKRVESTATLMRVLLFTGKGGVGKTTTATATALRLADLGCKTLLLSTDAAHSVSDALAVSLTGEPAEVAPALWAVELDTQHRLEAAWVGVQRYLLQLFARSGVDPVAAEELTVLPGVEEVLALLAVRDLAESGNWDAVVVDCAPTAETLRLLALPEALGWYLAKIFPAHRRLARSMRPLAALLGRGDVLPPDTLFAAVLTLMDELASVRQLLADSEVTSVRLVLTPEAVVTAEARRTFTALSLYGYDVDMVVANRVFPAGTGDWQQGWAAAQRRELDAVRESFAGVEVREVGYAAREPVGVDGLREVGVELYGSLPGRDPAAVSATSELLRVEPDEDDFVLRQRLPLAPFGAVDAVRVEDDLVITVGGYRRVLALPSVLRRCVVVGGSVVDTELRVRFRPDPDLWPTGSRP